MTNVRVRIAPSPTGTPHVGTAYIALFNYCFARSHGGAFVLRIEDTDQERSHPEYETQILNALRWTGLSWDEGPDVGGPHGPYRQSERSHLYREHAHQLLASGHAYKCFCTPERLAEIRAERFAAGHPTGYDGHCSHLSAAELERLEAEGVPYTIRMRVPETGTCVIPDPLRGAVRFEYQTVDHQVLLKSDGFPTYHLANVVDDHLMGITHVIRGEEWLPSLPKHLLLYAYFGWQPPVVYHLPLLRNPDRSKLSKRKNPTSILYYQQIGILPEALLNFLGLMAYTPPGDDEIFSLEHMVASFDIGRMTLSGPIFDLQKLTWINQKHISALPDGELLERLKSWRFNDAFLARLIPMMKDRMHKLGDFMTRCDFLFYSDIAVHKEALVPKGRELEETRDMLQILIWELEGLPDFRSETLEATATRVGALYDWSLRDISHALRLALCGKTVAPPLYPIMEILGSDVCRNRLMAAVSEIGPLGKKKLAKLQKQHEQRCQPNH